MDVQSPGDLIEAAPGEGEQRQGLFAPTSRIGVAELPQALLELDPVEQIDDFGQGTLRLGLPLCAAFCGAAPAGRQGPANGSSLPSFLTFGFETHWLFPCKHDRCKFVAHFNSPRNS
jgi:hypothetical protein